MIAVGATLLILGLILSVVSELTVLRVGSRPAGNDESWELARKRGFRIAYPAALCVGAGVLILYASGAFGFLEHK